MVGDPFFGTVLKAFGSVAGPLIKKGAGALVKKVLHRGQPPPPGSSMVGQVTSLQRSPVFAGGAIPIEENTSYIQRVLKGRAAPAGMPPGSRVQVFPAGVAATQGFRRRYRRMHVTNVKALRRAMRRVQGFAKLAKSTISFTTHTRLKRGRKR
jgi:hypothetical protein